MGRMEGLLRGRGGGGIEKSDSACMQNADTQRLNVGLRTHMK